MSQKIEKDLEQSLRRFLRSGPGVSLKRKLHAESLYIPICQAYDEPERNIVFTGNGFMTYRVTQPEDPFPLDSLSKRLQPIAIDAVAYHAIHDCYMWPEKVMTLIASQKPRALKYF